MQLISLVPVPPTYARPRPLLLCPCPALAQVLALLLGARDDALYELAAEAIASVAFNRQYTLRLKDFEGLSGLPPRLIPRLLEMAAGHGFSGFDCGGGQKTHTGTDATSRAPACKKSMIEALQDVEDHEMEPGTDGAAEQGRG